MPTNHLLRTSVQPRHDIVPLPQLVTSLQEDPYQMLSARPRDPIFHGIIDNAGILGGGISQKVRQYFWPIHAERSILYVHLVHVQELRQYHGKPSEGLDQCHFGAFFVSLLPSSLLRIGIVIIILLFCIIFILVDRKPIQRQRIRIRPIRHIHQPTPMMPIRQRILVVDLDGPALDQVHDEGGPRLDFPIMAATATTTTTGQY
mmetsp:Transcript_30229/g.51496  ORF Transcript_30229/g.51496 Transcript_30229/m.51496 type:complete len:203 (+) Transcript_30229:1300-1908(+)